MRRRLGRGKGRWKRKRAHKEQSKQNQERGLHGYGLFDIISH